MEKISWCAEKSIEDFENKLKEIEWVFLNDDYQKLSIEDKKEEYNELWKKYENMKNALEDCFGVNL